MPHASAAPSDAGLPLARPLFFGGIALCAVLLGAAVAIAIAAVTAERLSLLVVVPIFLVMFAMFATYPIMFGAYRIRAEKRMRAVAALHPDAYLLHVVIRPKIRKQLRAAAAALGVAAARVPYNNYAVLCADSQQLAIYGGSGVLAVALPTSALAQVTHQPVTIGVRTLTEFILTFRNASAQLFTVELLPVRWPGVVVRSVPPEEFPAEFAAMQAATHPGL